MIKAIKGWILGENGKRALREASFKSDKQVVTRYGKSDPFRTGFKGYTSFGTFVCTGKKDE